MPTASRATPATRMRYIHSANGMRRALLIAHPIGLGRQVENPVDGLCVLV
jgi:hypothetical protein